MQLHYISRSPAAINPTDYLFFRFYLPYTLILVPASLKNRKVKFFTISNIIFFNLQLNSLASLHSPVYIN